MMAKNEDTLAWIQEVNGKMTELQADETKKAAAVERAQEKLDLAKAELEEAKKAVKDYSPTHKDAGRKMMAIINSDPAALQKAMDAMIKQQTA